MSGAHDKSPIPEPPISEPRTQSGHHPAAALAGGQSEVFGRYVLHAPIARGGMATVHIARLVGAEGFSRIVAAKRLHPQFTEDEEFVTMFLDEARIASKIHHPNVVPVFDVFLSGTEVIIVQEYVHGVPLDKLFKASRERQEPIPVPVVVAIVSGILAGLHAAHETKDEMGESLDIVHRDVSPQNVMISADGTPRLLDFGIAKAKSSAHVTRAGFFKGKVSYMAPEQLRGESPNRTADVYAVGIMLWELLVGRRLHHGRGEAELFSAVLSGAIPDVTGALEDTRKSIPEQRWAQLARLDEIVKRATALHSKDRYKSAAAMQDDLVHAVLPASAHEVAAWVKAQGAEYLDGRQRVIASNEESWRTLSAPTSSPSGRSLTLSSGVQPTRAVGMPYGESSVPTPAYVVAPDKSKPFLLALIAVLLVGIGAAVTVILVRREPAPAPRAVPTPTELPADDTAPPSTAAAPPPAAPPVTAAAPPTADTPVAQKPAPPPPRPQPRWTPPPPRPAPHPAPASPSPAAASSDDKKDNCSPPFYFDGSKKVFKPGCI